MISYCAFRLFVLLLLIILSPVTGKLAAKHLPKLGRLHHHPGIEPARGFRIPKEKAPTRMCGGLG